MTREPTPLVTVLPCDKELAYDFTRTGWMKGSDGIAVLAELAARHRLAALEAAAKVAENACYNPPAREFQEGWNDAGDHIATAIRSLSQPVEGSAGAFVDEAGWVIEYGPSEPCRPRYWGGVHGWTYDNLKAVRFVREIDAQSIAESMDDGVPGNYRLAEHIWAPYRNAGDAQTPAASNKGGRDEE